MRRRIRKELLDELLAGYEKPEHLTGPEGLLKQLTGALVERALGAELTDHLGYEPGGRDAESTSNARNGSSPKTLITEQGEIPIEVPPSTGRARSSRSW
jgi:putative transposase